MARNAVWHESRSSSLFGGTFTSWYGATVRKRDVQTRWFGRGSNCPACQRAKKNHKRGGAR